MTFADGQLPPDVLKALESGRTIDAIKKLRKATGLGLAEAKSVIDAHVKRKPTQASYGLPTEGPDAGRVLPDVVMDALQRGDKVAAVKLLRERLGIGLNAAKERIDAASGSPGVPHLDHRIVGPTEQIVQSRPGLAPGEVPRSNGAFWLVLLLVAVLVGYLLIGR
jgi:ribosomal protein L7/L12